MAERIRVGDRLPFFLYDTPYSAGNRFRDLLDAQAPLVLVFMANFGHPITRTFASRYADTYTSLHDGDVYKIQWLPCAGTVSRSRPSRTAAIRWRRVSMF